MQSYKALVWTGNDISGSSNALRFATAYEANAYVRDLAHRWTAVIKTAIEKTNDPVNYRWDTGEAKAVPIDN